MCECAWMDYILHVRCHGFIWDSLLRRRKHTAPGCMLPEESFNIRPSEVASGALEKACS